jgi:nicotinate-nucleotide adenylyltransferase
MEISSTFIRDALKMKMDIRHFLPAKVYDYIVQMHYYE